MGYITPALKSGVAHATSPPTSSDRLSNLSEFQESGEGGGGMRVVPNAEGHVHTTRHLPQTPLVRHIHALSLYSRVQEQSSGKVNLMKL